MQSFVSILFTCVLAAHAQDRLWQLRNLGKAFYENPSTQKEAVVEFRKALSLSPNSVRERLNYGLALLRAGDTALGVSELVRVQRLDPQLPHSWFNLGITYKKQGENANAILQFRGMVQRVPNEAVAHYQLGTLYRAEGNLPEAVREMELARDLDPRLAAAHFQLYNLYRQMGKAEAAAGEMALFQQRKKEQEGAAVPEDVEWSDYAEIYDPLDAFPASQRTTQFADHKIAPGFGGESAGAIMLDVSGNHRRDVLAWSPAGLRLFRDGVTELHDFGIGSLRGVRSVAVGDYDNDGLPDLCVLTASEAILYRNVKGQFEKQSVLATGSFGRAFWMDFDHDYDADLLLFGDRSVLLRNNGQAGFGDETPRFPFTPGAAREIQRFQLKPDTPGFDLLATYTDGRRVLYHDLLGGKYEAMAAPAYVERRVARAWISDDGWLHVEQEVIPAGQNWLRIALEGVKNAKVASGAVVEVKAGASYSRSFYEGVPLFFDSGSQAIIDTVRITWPNGLIQNEIRQPAGRLAVYKEAPRLSGSCPSIFTWNGQRFEFITDVLGVAPLGASLGDGSYFPVDHDEYVQIPTGSLQSRNGIYEIRITEELREVSYIDKVKLLALDHPAGLEIFTNDKFKSPPFPEFRLFGSQSRRYPIAATEGHGRDLIQTLSKKDGVYVRGFQRDQAGVAELHNLDLDFGPVAADNRAVLILSGWVDWADGSTFLSASQQHRNLVMPYLQVKDSKGNWRTVIEDMGMPAGKPKTIAVDLTGKFLGPSREVRIVTNLCLYWDEIFLTERSDMPPHMLTSAAASSATLGFRGFSKVTLGYEAPETFDYHSVSVVTMWNPTPGLYTRYGDVKNLLSRNDDRLLLMGSGDEVRLQFRTDAFPPLAKGWQRDFLLLVDGWAKDADANTAYSQSVEPLPFHSMSQYPYSASEHFPDGEPYRAYRTNYNTRPALRLVRPLGER